MDRNESEKLTNIGIPMETFTGPDRTGPSKVGGRADDLEMTILATW